MNTNAIVWCVDSNLCANLRCYASVISAMKHSKISDFKLITTKQNPFIYYFNKLSVNKQKIDLVYVDDDISELNTIYKIKTRWGTFALARFLLFKLDVFKTYKKILYLDCDTLIYDSLDSDLLSNPLYRLSVGMIPEITIDGDKQRNRLQAFTKSQKIDYRNKYYCNSGVILFNIQRILSKYPDIYTRILSLIKKYQEKLLFLDQDIFNILFNNDITYLNSKYNDFPSSHIPNTKIIIKHLVSSTADRKRNGIIQMIDSLIANNIL